MKRHKLQLVQLKRDLLAQTEFTEDCRNTKACVTLRRNYLS